MSSFAKQFLDELAASRAYQEDTRHSIAEILQQAREHVATMEAELQENSIAGPHYHAYLDAAEALQNKLPAYFEARPAKVPAELLHDTKALGELAVEASAEVIQRAGDAVGSADDILDKNAYYIQLNYYSHLLRKEPQSLAGRFRDLFSAPLAAPEASGRGKK